jgi:hypothetical protein
MSKMVQQSYIDDMRQKHGENSYEFRVRVMGEFHLEDSGFVIPRTWVTDSVNREIDADTSYIIWGIDVSAGKNDKSAIAKRNGNHLLEPVKEYGGLDVRQFVNATLDEYHGTPLTQRPQEICIDVIGVGQGYYAYLKNELRNETQDANLLIRGINVSGLKARSEIYRSYRVELWAKAREWFESQTCRMPMQQELINQLCGVEWEISESNGKWVIKDKNVGGKSPDMADAFVLTFAGRKGTPLQNTQRNLRFANQQKMVYSIGSASYLQGD